MAVRLISNAMQSLAMSWILWVPVVFAVSWWYIESRMTIIEHMPESPITLYGTEEVRAPGVLYVRWKFKKNRYCRGNGRMIAVRIDRPWFRAVLSSFPATMHPEEADGTQYHEWSYPIGIELAPVRENPKKEVCYRTENQVEYQCNWMFATPVYRIPGPNFCVMGRE